MAIVGLIGTGTIGGGIAHNLLKAGHRLKVWNRTTTKAASLVQCGATLATSPADAAGGVDYIITCVADDDSSREVWTGRNGILSGELTPGAVAIECTTVSLDWVQKLSALLNSAGLCYIDSPVTGGPGGAQSGSLTVFAGANEDDLSAARSLLGAFSSTVIHFGPPGAGTTFKLISNLMSAVQIVALAEAIGIAEKSGLDMHAFINGLTSIGAGSPIVKAFATQMVDRRHKYVSFPVRLMHKDASYAANMASQVGQNLRLSVTAIDIMNAAVAAGLGDRNLSAIVDLIV
jgi:3-hydroxyisobutyrate dehydrogenase